MTTTRPWNTVTPAGLDLGELRAPLDIEPTTWRVTLHANDRFLDATAKASGVGAARAALGNAKIAAAYGVMAATPEHRYEVLVLEPDRALRWFAWIEIETCKHLAESISRQCWAYARATLGWDETRRIWRITQKWPLPNVVHVLPDTGRDQTEMFRQLPGRLQAEAKP